MQYICILCTRLELIVSIKLYLIQCGEYLFSCKYFFYKNRKNYYIETPLAALHGWFTRQSAIRMKDVLKKNTCLMIFMNSLHRQSMQCNSNLHCIHSRCNALMTWNEEVYESWILRIRWPSFSFHATCYMVILG